MGFENLEIKGQKTKTDFLDSLDVNVISDIFKYLNPEAVNLVVQASPAFYHTSKELFSYQEKLKNTNDIDEIYSFLFVMLLKFKEEEIKHVLEMCNIHTIGARKIGEARDNTDKRNNKKEITVDISLEGLLLSAAEIKNTKMIVSFLLKRATEINIDIKKIKNTVGLTLLDIALKNNNIAAAKKFVEAGIDVNRICWREEYQEYDTLLHLAIDKKNLKMVKNVVVAGADVNFTVKNTYRNSTGETPLYLAIMRDNVEIVKFLVRSGANIYAKNFKSLKTPLEYANESMAAENPVVAYLKDQAPKESSMIRSSKINEILKNDNLYPTPAAKVIKVFENYNSGLEIGNFRIYFSFFRRHHNTAQAKAIVEALQAELKVGKNPDYEKCIQIINQHAGKSYKSDGTFGILINKIIEDFRFLNSLENPPQLNSAPSATAI